MLIGEHPVVVIELVDRQTGTTYAPNPGTGTLTITDLDRPEFDLDNPMATGHYAGCLDIEMASVAVDDEPPACTGRVVYCWSAPYYPNYCQ